MSREHNAHAREGRCDCITFLLDSAATTIFRAPKRAVQRTAVPGGNLIFQLILLGPKTWDLETAIAIEPLLLTELLPTFVRRLWGATARRQATTRASPKAAQLWPYPGGLSI